MGSEVALEQMSPYLLSLEGKKKEKKVLLLLIFIFLYFYIHTYNLTAAFSSIPPACCDAAVMHLHT